MTVNRNTEPAVCQSSLRSSQFLLTPLRRPRDPKRIEERRREAKQLGNVCYIHVLFQTNLIIPLSVRIINHWSRVSDGYYIQLYQTRVILWEATHSRMDLVRPSKTMAKTLIEDRGAASTSQLSSNESNERESCLTRKDRYHPMGTHLNGHLKLCSRHWWRTVVQPMDSKPNYLRTNPGRFQEMDNK